jgi:hypothetical protein
MVRSTEHLETQLLPLPTADRARLAEILLASLDAEAEAGPASAAEEAWRVEGEHRLADLREQVFSAAVRRLTAYGT